MTKFFLERMQDALIGAMADLLLEQLIRFSNYLLHALVVMPYQ